MNDTNTGNRDAQSIATDYQALVFVIQQLLGKLVTVVLVRVEAVTNAGSLASCAYVNVQPLLNQMTGGQQPLPHGVVYNVPVWRLQGGSSAAVIDPVAGDIGIVVVSYRDNSTLTAADLKAPGSLQGGDQTYNPGSMAQFDWASGVYMGGVLNGTVSQYLLMNAMGVTMVSPTKITLQAPNIQLTASSDITLNGATIDSSENFTTSGNVKGALVTGTSDVVQGVGGSAVSLQNHIHSGVAMGGGVSGAPVPGT